MNLCYGLAFILGVLSPVAGLAISIGTGLAIGTRRSFVPRIVLTVIYYVVLGVTYCLAPSSSGGFTAVMLVLIAGIIVGLAVMTTRRADQVESTSVPNRTQRG